MRFAEAGVSRRWGENNPHTGSYPSTILSRACWKYSPRDVCPMHCPCTGNNPTYQIEEYLEEGLWEESLVETPLPELRGIELVRFLPRTTLTCHTLAICSSSPRVRHPLSWHKTFTRHSSISLTHLSTMACHTIATPWHDPTFTSLRSILSSVERSPKGKKIRKISSISNHNDADQQLWSFLFYFLLSSTYFYRQVPPTHTNIPPICLCGDRSKCCIFTSASTSSGKLFIFVGCHSLMLYRNDGMEEFLHVPYNVHSVINLTLCCPNSDYNDSCSPQLNPNRSKVSDYSSVLAIVSWRKSDVQAVM